MCTHAINMQRNRVVIRHLSHLHKTIESGWMESFTCVQFCMYARLHAFISQNNSPRVCPFAPRHSPSLFLFLFPSFEADISERNGARMHRLIVWKMQCSRYGLRMLRARYVVLRSYHKLGRNSARNVSSASSRSLVMYNWNKCGIYVTGIRTWWLF